MVDIYTIGYEGRTVGSLISNLEENGVDLLADVREYPASRKKGLSKRALKTSLEKRGIDYMHLPELGTSRELRKKYNEDGDFTCLKKKFKDCYPARKNTLQGLLSVARRRTLCLMCYEADPLRCHRSILADELVDLSGGEVNLFHL
jgi:uncharacterized protein (DUF488 family)